MIPSKARSLIVLVGRHGAFTAFSICLLTSALSQARSVVNGDILYTGEAHGSTEAEAGFLAEAQAIRSVMGECSLAHKDIKVFDKAITRDPKSNGFLAKAVAGLSFESCDEAKTSDAKKRLRLTSPIIVEDQALYSAYLKSTLTGRERAFDLRPYLEGRFKKIQHQLDGIADRLETPKERYQPVTVQKYLLPQVVEQRSSIAQIRGCSQEARRLMQSAERAALKNHPPGNLAQGEALDFYNEAIVEYQRCN